VEADSQSSKRSTNISRNVNRWMMLSVFGMTMFWFLVAPKIVSQLFSVDIANSAPIAIAAIGSAIIALTTLLWTTEKFSRHFPVASVLLTVTWRLFGTAGMAAISAATKWPEHKSFCFWLLGCYFSFFVLESAFSIARISYLSRR
jgi:hypothetical protein